MLESDMNIRDEVLQKELSRASDERMKNIAATIQKEQNAIIRNEHSHELIIQGVAGSGKTSVALHRIAFLLYRYKGTLTSQNILILSPNKVFSDYISNVLPELGEENIMEMGFDELAARELKGICDFQTFNEQVAELAASSEEAVVERIRSKARIDFVHELERFAAHVGETYFVPHDISFDNVQVAKEEIQSAYRAAGKVPFTQRMAKTAETIAGSARDEFGQKLNPSAVNKIKTAIKKMCKTQNMLVIYKDFYHYMGKPEWFKPKKPKMLEFSDVFPLVYLKLLLEGPTDYHDIKHVVVDEMQDYTAVQYAVLSRLFPCKKTILGDSNQSVNPYSSSSLTGIRQVFPEADTVELLKSYRSTLEIIRFAQRINPNSNMIPIERHGAFPQIKKSDSRDGERSHSKQTMIEFLKSEHEGIIVASSHMAKGLEFDHVLVPFCDADNYRTEMDRGLLYIACTRAMHMLTLTYSGEASPLLPEMT
ncbi:AAA family ATPase [Paenibacillus melissococcoides]|nr:UvrD-helicase domain-containing protein [Paenibacillus melissococcoides]MEB9893322.1 AAA family ATPase [Bacillus cereus]CAH8704812.1 AAA family ATPase [Paenibacillus melissococcoides]CAH8708037.1 AAA family ATPase [Paenibacillus melissococcoides]